MYSSASAARPIQLRSWAIYLGLESSRLNPYNPCQKLETSIAEACTPLPIRRSRAPSEVVRFFITGFVLPIAELFLLRSSMSIHNHCSMHHVSMIHLSCISQNLLTAQGYVQLHVPLFVVCLEPSIAF